ncbi:MAG: tRNA lysidine(34) synthetase TilS, partial [Litorilinea sp.]
MPYTPRPTYQHSAHQRANHQHLPHSDADTLPALDAELLTALQAAQTRHGLLPQIHATNDVDHTRRQTVIVAVSGGADSVFLLHALYALRQAWRLALHVAHLDHALRADSVHDAAFVQELAATWNLPFHHARLEPGALDQHPDGLEAAARQARYAFLCQIAHTHTPAEQTPLLAVAHHLDDQAETVLLNLARGSGLSGLAGMAWVTEMQMSTATRPVRVMRPLLGLRRAQLRAELHRLGVPWREDASNTDARFLRNHVRQTILPALATLNPQIHVTLARTAEIVAGDAARLAVWDGRTLATLTCQHVAQQRRVLDLAQFNALDWATRRGVLRQAIAGFANAGFANQASDKTIDARAIGFAEIEGLIERLAHAPAAPPAPGPHPLAGGLAWTYFPPTQETP